MAEATTEITVTPKQLGKHLRSIRRKKGLSLSEVARGAGLSRRELVAYERGKAPIPENDLWVLAGSCGVDVAELMPSASSYELTAAAESTSVGDTVSQLRRTQEEAGITPYLPTLQKLRALPPGKRIPVKDRELEEIATALGSTPRSIEQKLQDVLHVSPDEAERLRAMILVPQGTKGRPRALAAAPSALAAAPEPTAVPVPTPPEVIATATPDAAAPAPTPVVAPVPAPAATPEPTPEPVQTFPEAPAAFLDQPLDAPVDPVHGHDVDVFEELARLPEPVPLGDPSAPVPDLLAPPDPFAAPLVVPVGPPEGAVELVDSSMPPAGAPAWSAADAPPIDVAMRQGSATWDLGEPPLVAKASPVTDPTSWETGGWQPPAPEGALDAPAGFWEGTDEWAPERPPAEGPPAEGPPAADAFATEVVDPSSGGAPEHATSPVEPVVVGEDTWTGTTWDPETWSVPEPAVADATATPVEVNPWALDEWPREPADRGAWDHTPDPAAVDTGFYVDWGTSETDTPPGFDPFAAAAAAPSAADAVGTDPPWAASPGDDAPVWETWPRPDDTYEVTDSFAGFATGAPGEARDAGDALGGFGPDESVDEAEAVPFATTDLREVTAADEEPADSAFADPPGWDVWSPERDPIETVETVETVETTETVDTTETVETVETVDTTETVETVEPEAPASEPDVVFEAPTEVVAPPTHISWRADEEPVDRVDGIAPADIPLPAEWAPDAVEETAAGPGDDRAPAEFLAAGPDWQLGNALPLVEVRGQGGLVMRRADERWALADVITPTDFVAEVEVDFRSGPGLGVLFRASVDDDGRMSGYSFDVDPIYDGGGYLVRQWLADRELWNPIARVSGDDPTSMYGSLLVRIEVCGEHLSAQVNGVEVLTVENLKQASADRGRDAATGDRVGVQAWSSSDLVIDTVRVASL